jgi:hypothetical protein
MNPATSPWWPPSRSLNEVARMLALFEFVNASSSQRAANEQPTSGLRAAYERPTSGLRAAYAAYLSPRGGCVAAVYRRSRSALHV